jgi:hypothetical protein
VTRFRHLILQSPDPPVSEALQKAEKKLSAALNKAKKTLKDTGVMARKDKLKEYKRQGLLLPLELLIPIREPDINPTVVEQASLLPDFYPELVQQIKELKAYKDPPTQLDFTPDDNDVVISTTPLIYEKDIVEDIPDSSPPPSEYIDSSDAESIDSIRQNADFVAF